MMTEPKDHGPTRTSYALNTGVEPMRSTRLKVATLGLMLAGLVFSAMPVAAQKDYTELQFPPLNDIATPTPTRVVLDNGIILYLVEDRRLPMINLSARFGVGSVNEPAERIGLAGITGAVIRTGGSTSMSGDEIDETLEGIGATVETQIGLVSGSAFMSALKDNVDTVLPILADILMHPAFPEDKIELEKVTARSTISRRNDDPTDMAFREYRKLIYGAESVYARHAEYATIDAITRDDLVAFHRDWMHPDNTMFGVWGDFDTDEMVKKISDVFGGWEKAGFVRPDLPDVDYTYDSSVNLVRKDDINQSTVVLGHIGGVRDNPDYFALRVMNDILSGGFSGRLFRIVRSEQGLAYAVFGIYSANYNFPGIFYVACMTSSETTAQAIRSLRHEVGRMTTDEITEEELNLAKESFLNSFVFNFDSRREIIDRQMTYEYYGYPQDFLEKTKTGIEKVTVEDVKRVAREYLQPDKMRLIVVGNDQDFDEEMSAFGEVNEIDVTIALPVVEAPEATEDDVAMGRELLMRSAEALGGIEALTAIQSLRVTAEVTVIQPMGEMVIGVESLVAFPDKSKTTMQTPMGDIDMTLIDDQAWVVDPMGNTQPLPDQQRDSMREELWRNLVFLYNRMDAEGLTVQHTGREEIEGRATEVLLITPPGLNPFKLYLDAETMLPYKKAGQSMSQQGPVEAESTMSDYREVEGIKLPFKESMKQNGNPSGESVTQTIEINPEIPADAFAAPE
ncbi:MAG: insulinase family protein [Gemmatimonadetes bacterium]|nr:insulinase family protein [Gemmatimonadota bacterium]MYG86289.1 insulinase family protein [Gemmatimonadota bacterium]MYJ91022.1 insulinase family protein [Gemmatimonadota bacterium]